MKLAQYVIESDCDFHSTFYDVSVFDVIYTRCQMTSLKPIMAAFTSIEQRAYIKIENYRQKNLRQIQASFEQAFGDQALSYSLVARWVVDFRKGREAIKNAHHSGRPEPMTWIQHQKS